MKKSFIIIILAGGLSVLSAQTDNAPALSRIDALLAPAHDIVADISVTGFRDKTSVSSGTYRIFLSGRKQSCALVGFGENNSSKTAWLYADNMIKAYLPAAKAFFPVAPFARIPGTCISIEDLFLPSFSESYTVVSSEKTKTGALSLPAVKLGLKAKTGTARYPELSLFIDEKTGLITSIDAYNDMAQLVKTVQYSGYRASGSSYIPTRMLVIDALETGSAALVVFTSTIVTDIPDYVFTRPYIEYLAP